MNAQDEWAEYLDPETDPAVRSELRAGLVDDEAAALDRIVEVLRDEALWGGPSGDMRAQLLATASLEADSSSAARIDAVGPAPSTLGDQSGPTLRSVGPGGVERAVRRGERGSRARTVGTFAAGVVAAAAAAAILFFALGQTADVGDFSTFEVAGTELTPDLDATVDIEPRSAGVAITLHIKGLPPAPEGQYYAGWLMPESAGGMAGDMADEMVGIGSFHWREGGIPIELWSGVETDRYPILVVTLQDEDVSPMASERVVMTARVDSR